MTDPVITTIDQVTPQWLTDVLCRSDALTRGGVTAFRYNRPLPRQT